MSWEANSWASKQRMKLPQEQLVLYVVANCADPDGVAFGQWKGRDHWWTYLCERTRLSKSSLFRHLNTIEELGLGVRSTIVLADGSKRPVIRLDLSKRFDIDAVESQSHGETEQDEASNDSENVSDISEQETPSLDDSGQSHGETGSHGETEGDGASLTVRPNQSHGETDTLCSKLDSKSSPLPPSGGLPARDELWDQFVASWGEPIPKMALANGAWQHAETAKRPEIVAAARGYWAWLRGHTKPPSAQSAQSFIRDAAGWAQWLRYAPDADSGKPTAATMTYPLASHEGRAISAVHEIAGVSDFLRGVMVRNGVVSYRLPVTPRLLALANMPTKDDWVVLDRNQAGAWESLLSDSITVQVRSRMREGSRAPWSWPPRKDGTLSGASDPPDLTNEDYEALSSEGQR